MASTNSKKIFDLDRKMTNLSRMTEKILSEQTKKLSQLDTQQQEIKFKVVEIRKAINSHLDKIEKDLDNELSKKHKECSDKVIKTKTYIIERCEEIEKMRKELKATKDKSFDSKTFKSLEDNLEKQEVLIRNAQSEAPVFTLNFKSTDNMKTFEKHFTKYGVLAVHENVTSDSSVPKVKQVKKDATSIKEHNKLPLVSTLKTTDIGKNIEVFRICFIPKNRILFCELNAKCIRVCNIDGSNNRSLELEFKPINVSSFDGKRVIVSYDKGIQIIDLESLTPSTFITRGAGCRAIASFQDKIWVRNGFQYLNMIDTSGKLLKELKVKFDPNEICVSVSGNMYSISAGKDVIYSISPDGHQKVFYSHSELTYPVGIAADDKENVYVAGYGSNNVHKVSRDGQTSSIVLTADDGIDQPTGLAYNRETNELLIVHEDTKNIRIYKLV